MKQHPAYWLIIAVALLIVGEGCGNKESALPEVIVDRSECAKCRMLISDARFASMLHTSEYLMFDDLGCMLKYERTIPKEEINGTWVRDYVSNTWIPEREAIFLRSDDITTPMEYGYIATTTANSESAALQTAIRINDVYADFSKRFLTEAP